MSEDIEMMTKELPLNFGPLKGANANARLTGPCGDTMEFWLNIDNDKILTATFTTDGCDNSIICGSTAGYMVQNNLLDTAYAVTQEQVLLEIGYLPSEFKHCALLAVNTIKKTIESYKKIPKQ
ncbi:MAG: nitrogen-fixing NifU protein [uncultured bacterium]|nr:MAG: nitrogen-fixing NifU protein [uncultured bacterium]